MACDQHDSVSRSVAILEVDIFIAKQISFQVKILDNLYDKSFFSGQWT